MFYSLIPCLSFILLVSHPFFFKSLPSKQSTLFISWFRKSRIICCLFHGLLLLFKNSVVNKAASKVDNGEQKNEMSLLDLPDLVLECILERLSPAGLCSTAGVCRSLRDKCTTDYLWDKHMNHKWDRLISGAAYKKWQCHIASLERGLPILEDTTKPIGGFFQYFLRSFIYTSKLNSDSRHELTSLPPDSIMALYLSLETGKFWFPSQVYNRENGHVGFMLSCYDAQVCYDFRTDTFTARYSARGGQTMEENIEWNRLRKPAADTAAANVLHVSHCLTDLEPNDIIEIQWTRSKEFPYGWWYGVVGHLDSCNADEFNCQCHTNETVVLEFKQYSPGSRWRRVAINRNDHREVGNEADGFYGGIRKLYHGEEISTWKNFWAMRSLQ